MRKVALAGVACLVVLAGCGRQSDSESKSAKKDPTTSRVLTSTTRVPTSSTTTAVTIPTDPTERFLAMVRADPEVVESAEIFSMLGDAPLGSDQRLLDGGQHFCDGIANASGRTPEQEIANWPLVEPPSATAKLGLLAVANLCPEYQVHVDNVRNGVVPTAPTTAPPADPRISMAEFEQIANGMTRQEAAAIIGSDGEVLSEYGAPGEQFYSVIVLYDGVGELGANANLQFQGGRLIGKSQYGLR